MNYSARTLLGIGVILVPLVLGCGADTSGLSTLSVDDLASLLTQKAEVVVCDANGADTRSDYGIIPGARLLSHYEDYEVTELPAEKSRKLVFYCASEMCSAAPSAARKAIAHGYPDVHVLPAGIKGWVKANHPVEQPPVS